MKRYIGTKIIEAQPMNRAEYNVYRNWELPANENGEDEGYLVEYLDGGKPNEVMFDVLFPGSGLYKGWGEFKRAGKVLVVPIVLSVGM